MLKHYINPEKKTTAEKAKTILNYLVESWLEIICLTLFVYFFFRLKGVLADKKEEEIKKLLEIVITSASIISAIVITYLISKAIQVRQEKQNSFSEFHKLTQQTHSFRNCIYILYKNYNFLVGDVKSKVETKYKEITYFDIRKSIFVNGKDLNEREKQFLDDESINGLRHFYLELKSFFPGEDLFDPILYREYEVRSYYNPLLLELWITFDPANSLWYYFEYKYYEENFRFDKISQYDRDIVLRYAKRFDEKRYSDVKFDRKLFSNMGNQFKNEILPRLYELSLLFERTPSVINYLTIILMSVLTFGVVIPLLLLVLHYFFLFSVLSISLMISSLIYFIFSFYRQIKREVQII